MFDFSLPDEDKAAFIKYDDAKADELKITDAVKKGFIVRTRADGPNVQNRNGDYTQQQAAFRSGAQIISTDYYRADIRYMKKPKKFTNYVAKFNGREIGRINTVNVPASKVKE